jgi:hypothetical protein
MSLAGYRNLEWLRARLLPADLGEEGEWDADIEQIGQQVAAMFDRATGRTLRRTVGAVYETTADMPVFVVGCYPIETLTSVILITGADETNITDQVRNVQKSSGVVFMSGASGDGTQTIRATVTGGYWCQEGLASMPSGATALPDDLLGAWVSQCRAVCEAENTFRQKGAEKPGERKGSGARVDSMDMAPDVRRVLQLYSRFG